MAISGMTTEQLIELHKAGLNTRLRRLATLVEDARRELAEGRTPSGSLAGAAIDADEHASVLNALSMLDGS